MNSTYRERIEEMKQEFFASDKSEKSWDLTVGLRLEQLIRGKQIEILQMVLDSAHDQEEASERRWSRGTFIKAIEETIDDIKNERRE